MSTNFHHSRMKKLQGGDLHPGPYQEKEQNQPRKREAESNRHKGYQPTMLMRHQGYQLHHPALF